MYGLQLQHCCSNKPNKPTFRAIQSISVASHSVDPSMALPLRTCRALVWSLRFLRQVWTLVPSRGRKFQRKEQERGCERSLERGEQFSRNCLCYSETRRLGCTSSDQEEVGLTRPCNLERIYPFAVLRKTTAAATAATRSFHTRTARKATPAVRHQHRPVATTNHDM